MYAYNTVDNHRIIADTNSQTYTKVTRQGRMALTGVDAQNKVKCLKQVR